MPWNSQFWTSLSLDSLLWLLLGVSSSALLAGLFTGNIEDFLDASELLKRKQKMQPSSESGSLPSWQWKVSYLVQRSLHGSLLAKTMVSTYLMISVVGFVISSQHPVVLSDHDVNVMAVTPDQHTMLLDSPTRGAYQLIICHDEQNSRIMTDVNPQVGYRLDRLAWEATGRGCSSVNENPLTGPLGFWWHKEHGVVVKIASIKGEE